MHHMDSAKTDAEVRVSTVMISSADLDHVFILSESSLLSLFFFSECSEFSWLSFSGEFSRNRNFP